MRASTKQARVSRRRLPTKAGLASAGTGVGSAPGWLSFRRIVDIPFDACVAALESWRLQGPDSELHVGQSRLRGPIEHDPGSGTCRVEVRLARGPLRPLLRMRLNVDCWSCSPPGSALELTPCGRVRATARYFRAGHLLLDSLTRSLQSGGQIQAPGLPAGATVRTGSRSAGFSRPPSASRAAPVDPANFQRAADSASPARTPLAWRIHAPCAG